MISFVRPGLLGPRRRFVELFARPIREGMLADSPKAAVRLAKRRAYVLTRRLAPLVQRRDDAVLRAILPPMEELVLYARVAPLQVSAPPRAPRRVGGRGGRGVEGGAGGDRGSR